MNFLDNQSIGDAKNQSSRWVKWQYLTFKKMQSNTQMQNPGIAVPNSLSVLLNSFEPLDFELRAIRIFGVYV